MEALRRINKHFGITVICNLHSLDVARAYCDRLVGMAAGGVVFDGAAATLTDDAARDALRHRTPTLGRAPATNVAADPPLPVGALQQPVA